jgi:hypothetical protein
MERIPARIPETMPLELEGHQVIISYHPAIGDNVPAVTVPDAKPNLVSWECEDLPEKETKDLIDRNMDFILRQIS